VRVPRGNYDVYVESHVRRLEALRRAGIVERIGRTPEGGLRARRDLLPILERQEVERVGRKFATE
jgi:hypothetical protein